MIWVLINQRYYAYHSEVDEKGNDIKQNSEINKYNN